MTIKIGQYLLEYSINGIPHHVEDSSARQADDTIGALMRQGVRVFFTVRIKGPGIDMSLATPGSPGLGGGGRAPNREEQRWFDLWQRRGLDSPGFQSRNAAQFLKDVNEAFN